MSDYGHCLFLVNLTNEHDYFTNMSIISSVPCIPITCGYELAGGGCIKNRQDQLHTGNNTHTHNNPATPSTTHTSYTFTLNKNSSCHKPERLCMQITPHCVAITAQVHGGISSIQLPDNPPPTGPCQTPVILVAIVLY